MTNIADIARAALIEVISNNPKITVKQLRELVSETPALGDVTLADLLGEPAKGKKGKRRKAGGRARAADKSTQKRNVRTEEGRDAFDAEVLGALESLGGQELSATAVREAIGADPMQLRASLNRLIEKGAVTFTGKARGTRYTLL
ncbi:hypothetical protein G6O69_03710 [Pseudenhygromyxa sp. WMMC2535]|uniref:hypothetical protein n=1 Tax=Pseudenhygromyxa sp. WMMC2535 TaxID=2712867 RepID=UPI0015551D92|nr:hypothetical protein [Pseudenhygromyxa sp. WMMC2535]NVB36922.1 hypothetical protein [Pseudenhygromyxa sp. WMMC2535]